MTATRYDAVVVGLGGVGSFALRALAQQGVGGRFLGLERFPLGHAKGSSHGATRIFRQAYYEHDNYIPWLKHSVQEFHKLQQQHQQKPIMEVCGTLVMEASATSSYCQASFDAAIKFGIDVEKLSAIELQERFPQFNYQNHDMMGVYEPGGGFVRPENVMEACIKEATTSSVSEVEVLENAMVSSWSHISSVSSDGRYPEIQIKVKIENDSGPQEEIAITTQTMLVAAGGWTGPLIPSWAPHLFPHRQLQGWIDTGATKNNNNNKCFQHETIPVWLMCTPDYPLPIYGVPGDSKKANEQAWIKLGIHCRDDPLPDPTLNPSIVSGREMEELVNAAKATLHPSAWGNRGDAENAPNFASAVPCFYTMTQDSHFLIGSPYASVFAVSGLSGHGFKQTPALGQMMADYALGFDVMKRWNFGFCSPQRFGLESEDGRTLVSVVT